MMRSNMGKEMMGYGSKTKAKKMQKGGKTCPMDGCCVRGKTRAKRK